MIDQQLEAMKWDFDVGERVRERKGKAIENKKTKIPFLNINLLPHATAFELKKIEQF